MQPNDSNLVDVTADQWPDIDPIRPPAPPPLHVDNLPAVVRDFCRTLAAAFQVSTDMPILMQLAALSAAALNKVEFRVSPDWVVPASIFTCTPAPPGDRKSPVAESVYRPIYEWTQINAAGRRDSYRAAARDRALLRDRVEAARKRAVKDGGEAEDEYRRLALEFDQFQMPAHPDFLVDDVTSEALVTRMASTGERAAILQPEGDVFRIMSGPYTKGAPSLALWKKAHSGEPIYVSRQTRDGVQLERPALTIGIATQPSVLEAIRGSQMDGEGVMARFLYAVPDGSHIGQRLNHRRAPRIDDGARVAWGGALMTLLDLEPAGETDGTWEPFTIGLSPEAADVFADFQDCTEPHFIDGTFAGIQEWANKLHGQVVRIAGLLHLADQAAQGSVDVRAEISADAMRAAVELGHGLIAHARVALGAAGAATSEQVDIYVMKRVLDKQPSSVKELNDHCRGCSLTPNTEAVTNSLLRLASRGYLRVSDTQRGGRRAITINPKVLEPGVIADIAYVRMGSPDA